MSLQIYGGRTAARIGFIPAFAFIAFFSLIPAIATLALSFTDISATPGVPTNFVGLDNYERLLGAGLLSSAVNALIHTLVFAVAVSVIQNILALLIAVLLNRRSRFALFTRSVAFMPSVLGVTVVGLLWTLFFNPVGGPAQSALKIFGLNSSFFGDPNLALGLCIFVQIWMSVGYATLIYTAGLQAVPSELYEAGAIDGVTGFQRLRLLTIPIIAPTVTVNVLLSIIGSLHAFQLIYILTGTGNQATDVLALMLYRVGFGLGAGAIQDQGLASAISIVQFLIIAVVALIAYRYLRRRENDL